MKLLLDHMVTREVKKLLKSFGLDVITAKEQGLDQHLNSTLYLKASQFKRILLTYDRDFEDNEIGRIGNPSIIQIRIHPNTDDYVIPLLNLHFSDISKDYEIDHLITINEDGLKFDIFNK